MISGSARSAFSHAGMAPLPTLAGMGEDPAPVARFSTCGLGRVHAGEGEELLGRLEAVRVPDLGGDLGRAHRPYAGHGLQYGPDLGVEQLRNLRVKRLDLVVQEPALYARSLDAARMPTTGEKARMASERRERLLERRQMGRRISHDMRFPVSFSSPIGAEK